MLARDLQSPRNGAGDPLSRVREALEAADAQREALTEERHALSEALGDLEAQQRLGHATAANGNTVELHRARLQAIDATLGELSRAIPRLQGELARCEHQSRRINWQRRYDGLCERHEDRVQARAQLTAQLTALLDAIEEEAYHQAVDEGERMALRRDARGLDLADVPFPSTLEPWLAWAMQALTARWHAGLRKGGA